MFFKLTVSNILINKIFFYRFKFSLRRLTKTSDTRNGSGKSQNSLSAFATLPIVTATHNNESKLAKLSQYFKCLKITNANGSLINSNKEINLSMEFHKKETDEICDSCDISNSSLKDVENGAIENELDVYINDLKNGEI